MNKTILNRQFKHPPDGWYHLEAKGEHYNGRSRVKQVIDDVATRSIVETFNRDAAEHAAKNNGIEFPGMLIDIEHFKHDEEKETRAYGWLMELRNRADGYYGRINWTTTGKPAVDGGDFRFFSTEYDPEDLKVLNREGEVPRVRPMRLAGLTLTNDPNNKGQRGITNKKLSPDDPASPTTRDPVDIQNRRKATMKQIATKLGLSAEASEEAILGELSKLQNRAEKAEQALDPLTKERDLLKNRLAKSEETMIDGVLDDLGIKDEAERKTTGEMIRNSTDRDATVKVLKNRFNKAAPQTRTPLTNRATAGNPNNKNSESKSALRNRAVAAYMAEHKCEFEPAWNAMSLQKPELFTDEA